MKSIEEIISNYNKYEVPHDDRFGVRLCQFLNEDQMKSIGFELNKPDPNRTILEWTRENILNQLKDDVEFGFEKALYKRCISSSLMFLVVDRWNKILEEGLEDYDTDNGYKYYGLPLFKATSIKYGWDNPIGDDTGSESKYN